MRTEGEEMEETNKQQSVGDGGNCKQKEKKTKRVDKVKGNYMEVEGSDKEGNANVKRKDKREKEKDK